MLIPQRLTIGFAIIISLLIFGLSRYYSTSISHDEHNDNPNSKDSNQKDNKTSNDFASRKLLSKGEHSIAPMPLSNIFCFAAFYAIVLSISIFSKPDANIFANWANIEPVRIMQLGAAIMLAFFIPGYAILLVLTKSFRINQILKVILAYLTSILITGLTTYLSSITFDISVFEIKSILVALYLAILVIFVIFGLLENKGRIKTKSSSIAKNRNHIIFAVFVLGARRLNSFSKSIIKRGYELVVFASLFSLLVISTYYLYGGITLGDQWFHQGRAMLFLTGSFGQVASSGLESDYPPFQSALIAGLTSLSGIPLVNTYASIAFLNIIPLFSFYYFFSRWAPSKMRKANLLACSLFVICSGFGWIYLIGFEITSGLPISEQDAIHTISSIRSYILMPSNFILASHPDFSTALIYIAIPAGLVLLGLCRQIPEKRTTFAVIVTLITVLGILSHEEFYLFVIIASIIPILFRIKKVNFVYFGLLSGLIIVYVIYTMSPMNYYNFVEMFGYPLLVLISVFVAVVWAIYYAIQNYSILAKFIPIKVPKISFEFVRRNNLRDSKYPYLITLAALAAFSIYVSSFAIVALVTPGEANDEALRGKVSWYQYPMKLGLAGVLGIAFFLSYFFKKFEKEVFVFGLIIVISLLTAPYYDEHRFSKYVMLGMVPVASFLIFNALSHNQKKYKKELHPIIIMAIVTTGSLSTLLFIGYNSLAFENHDYVNDLGRRNFPSESEFHLIESLRNGTDFKTARYNVISTPDEYNFYKGTLLTKLSSFAGFPTGKLLQGRFVLNVTELDSLYRLLDYTNARFIVIPKDSITYHESYKLSEAARFALDNFQHYDENEKYVVLAVPPLAAPSAGLQKDGVAFVYNAKGSLGSLRDVNTTILEYANDRYNSNQLKQVTNSGERQQDNLTQRQNTMCSSKRNEGSTVWSKALGNISGADINYASVSFRLLNSSDNGVWADAGLRWNQGNNQYYASLSKNGLELYQKAIDNNNKGETDKKLLYQNTEVSKKENIWYNIKLENHQNLVNIFVDDTLKIRIPRLDLDSSAANISSVGISCYNSNVEFGPIQVGKINSSPGAANEFGKHYSINYALSMLALSNNQYDMYVDEDLSALSKRTIVLSFDPLEWDERRFNHYMEYVNHGGTLIVINSDRDLKGRFGKIFSIQENVTDSKYKFTGIIGNNKFVNLSGMAKNISTSPSANTSTIASYVSESSNSNQRAVPFAFEKQYPNGGKIILVNTAPYFDAISKSPGQYYMTLSNVLSVLGLELPKSTSTTPLTTLPIEQFVGSMDVSGRVNLTSNSFLLSGYGANDKSRPGSSQNSTIDIRRITVYKDNVLKNDFTKTSIKDLTLVGDYNVTISTKGLKLPYLTSHNNYFGLLMPKFNMTINLSDNPLSSGQIIVHDQANKISEIINIDRGSTIKFDNIQSKLPMSGNESISKSVSTPILLRSPEIVVDGNAKFTMLNFWWHYLENVKFNIQGLKTKLNFIDEYSEPYGNGTKVKYLTFMNSTTDLN